MMTVLRYLLLIIAALVIFGMSMGYGSVLSEISYTERIIKGPPIRVVGQLESSGNVGSIALEAGYCRVANSVTPPNVR
jgi:hypothetical protein